jgi:hypothetical protein
MKELSLREIAQKKFAESGRDGFLEDFVEEAYDDLAFMAMNPEDRELWIAVVEKDPSLIENPPLE